MVVLPDGATCTTDMELSENSKKTSEFDEIIEDLITNPDVMFSNQQRGESELSTSEKESLAKQLLSANPNNFLVRFGRHLQKRQLNCFHNLCNGTDKGIELKSTLDALILHLDNDKMLRLKKNRRFQALQELVAGNSYFQECEMMKRAPLLYQELIGQYLTEEERRLINRANVQESLVQILMEGIERDDARELQKQQAEIEDNAMEEEDTSSDEDETDAQGEDKRERIRINDSPEPEACHSRWGEFKELEETKQINKDEFYAHIGTSKTVEISSAQKELLREEFRSLMYQSFLDGKDDYDYETVDNNETYDNLDILTQDEQDKYFDSEEPTTMEEDKSSVSSEDELEIFMNSLHQSHPAVAQLSHDLQKL